MSVEHFLGVNIVALQSAGNFTVCSAIVLIIVGTIKSRLDVAKFTHQLEVVDVEPHLGRARIRRMSREEKADYIDLATR